MRGPLALTCLLLIASSGSAQAPTTLYFHLDGIQDFPINTQPPDDRYQRSESVGLGTASTSCIPENEAPVDASNNWHTWYGYSTPGYVEYEFEEDGGPRYHTERGIASDVRLDTSAPATVHWYLESQVVSGEPDPDPNNVPVVTPQVVVEATIRTGDNVKIGRAGYDDGLVIAQGRSQPVTLSPASDNHIEMGGRHIYEFQVPLDFEMPIIPRDEAFNLRMDAYVDVPLCSEGKLMPNTVRLHTSPDYRPRMDLTVQNPITILEITPRFVGDDVVVQTVVESPWGNYDVDEEPGGVTARVAGGSIEEELSPVELVQHHHVHGRHQEPVELTYLWEHGAAPEGTYEVVVQAWNDQHTAMAEGSAELDLQKRVAYDGSGNIVPGEDEDVQETPAPVAVGALVLLAAAMRRRTR